MKRDCIQTDTHTTLLFPENMLSDDRRRMYPWVSWDRENFLRIRLQFVKQKGFEIHPIIPSKIKRYFEMGRLQKYMDIEWKRGSNIFANGKDGDLCDKFMKCLRHANELPQQDST